MIQFLPLASECSRPFFDLLTSGDLFQWSGCTYAINGLGMTGVGFFVLATGFVGLKNWSESWVVPLTWTAIITPFLAATLLPGAVIRRIAGILTVAVAMLIIGLYYWWGRG